MAVRAITSGALLGRRDAVGARLRAWAACRRATAEVAKAAHAVDRADNILATLRFGVAVGMVALGATMLVWRCDAVGARMGAWAARRGAAAVATPVTHAIDWAIYDFAILTVLVAMIIGAAIAIALLRCRDAVRACLRAPAARLVAGAEAAPAAHAVDGASARVASLGVCLAVARWTVAAGACLRL